MGKRILSALGAAVLILSLAACQGGPEGPSVSEEPPSAPSGESSGLEPSSAGGEEASAPETIPEDTTELKVPLRMVSPDEEKEGDFPTGELGYTTQADVDACRQWLADLKVEDITALYGEALPYDHYWSGEMSPEDSRRVVDLLRSVAPGLAPLETGNPPTGGYWCVAVHTGDEAVSLGYNGEWVVFTRQGKGYIFDGTDTAVRESCGEIEALMSKYEALAPQVTKRFFGDEVQSIYALDVDAYLMAPVADGYPESKAIWEGLEDRAHSGGESSGYAFVIFTEEDKEYIYLDDSQEDTALNKYCQAALRDEFLHPSWLIHMTPERMVSANGITNRDELLALAKVLKEGTVGEETAVHDGPENPDMPANLVYLTVTFDSGVRYTLIGYADEEGNGPFSIHTSDLDKTVTYQSMNGSLGKIKTFLEKQR